MPTLVDRLGTISAIAGRIQTAAKFSSLLAANQLAQAAAVGPAAFVLPIGLRGGSADAVTGLFRQEIERTTGIVLVLRAAGDATGADALVQLTPLIDGVIAAVVGWGPDEAIGVYRLSRGELLSLTGGTLIYQLDLAIEDQLRIHA